MKWLQLPEHERREILEAVGGQTQLPVQAIEKDWWVTLALRACFSTPWAAQLAFKGGTSLSKAWQLIERFSEDIDLVLDRQALGFGGELTNSQIRKLRERSADFGANTFLPAMHQCLLDMGVEANQFAISVQPGGSADRDPQILEISYPTAYNGGHYLEGKVILEIGSRSLIEPASQRPIQSILEETLPGNPFSDIPFTVLTVEPKRTFLEKLFLLHEEWAKPLEKIRQGRMSRHLYDLHCLMDREAGLKALEDIVLYQQIVHHRSKYNAQRGLNYTSHHPSTLQPIPPETIQKLLEEDYRLMRTSMIYGKAPSFSDLMTRMHLLLERIRKIDLPA